MNNKLKLYKAAYILFVNLAIIFLLTLILDKLNILNIEQVINQLEIFIVIVSSTTLAIIFKDQLNKSANKIEKSMEVIFQTASYVFLAVILILIINSFIKIDILNAVQQNLVIIGICSGFLTFYNNRDLVIRKSKDFEGISKSKEEKNKIYPWLLLIITSIGLAIRVWDITKIGIMGDEIFQAAAAQSLNNHIIPHIGEKLYLRGIPISYFTHISAKITGLNELMLLRTPSIIIGTILIILVYFTMKEISQDKKFSLIASSMTAIELMVVQFSRISRFYIALSFFVILILYFNTKIKDENKKWKYLLTTFILMFLFEFAYTAIVIFSFTISQILAKKGFYKRKIFPILTGLMSIFLVSFLIYMYFTQKTFLLEIFSIKQDLSFLMAYISWITDNYGGLLILSIAPIVNIANFDKKTKETYLFLVVLTSVILATNITDYNYTIRTFVPVIPLLFITSTYSLKIISKIYGSRIGEIIGLTIITLLFVETLIFLPTSYGKEYHPYKVIYEKLPIVLDWENPSEFILKNYQTGDLVISHAVNPHFLQYYSKIKPDISARFLGTSRIIDGKAYDQYSDIEVIYDIDNFKKYISEKNAEGHRIFILSSGTNWPIENKFYERYFGKSTILESSPSFYKFLESNSDKLVYTGEDNLTKVYLFNP